MDTGDIPPPHLTTSINDLRRFSAALSAFITRYDEFHTHLNFIDASIDSKLPHHLVENTNPNLSNLTQLLETVCDQTITASPEACLLERNPKETASDSERSHEETVVENLGDETIPDVTETVVSEQNPNRMASNCDQSHENVILIVSESLEQINVSKKPEQAEEIDVSEEREETVSETSCDRGTAVVVSEAVALVQTANGMATNCEQSHENVILIVSESVGETSGSKKPEQTDNCKKPEELDTLMIPEEIDTSDEPEETVPETSCDRTIAVVPEAIVSVQNTNGMAANCEKSIDDTGVSKQPKQINICKNLEETVVLKKPEVLDSPMVLEETRSETSCDRGTVVVVPEAVASVQTANGMATNCEQSHENVILIVSESIGEISGSKKPEQTDNCKKPEELDTLMIPEEIDTSDEPEETVPETSCNQTIAVVPEAIVSVQNTNGMAADCEKSIDDTGVSMQPKQIDICKNPEETVVLKKPEEFDALMVPEETVSKTCCDQTTSVVQEAIVSKQIHENVLKKSEQTDICNNPEETVLLKKHEKTEARRKFLISVLEPMCQSMRFKEVRGHIAAHISEMINFREEIAKALKLANDPAKLVLTCIGRFFAQGSSTYCNPRQSKRDRRRMAAVLILECFVMISSDIAIVKRDREHAEKASVDWKKRMMEEGGFGHTDLLDARGLLLLISGFGFQDHVFTIQDIMDLIRASNVKEISTALRHSVFLIPKIPKVIYWMMQSNLEVEAVDLAYTFELEDTCHPQNILTTYLQNKIKDSNSSPLERMEHAFLQFNAELQRERECPARLLQLWNRRNRIGEPRRLDWGTVQQLGQYDRLYNMMSGPMIKLLSIEQPVYLELTLEFFSTYKYIKPASGTALDVTSKRSGVKFRLGGVWHYYSLRKLGQRLGIYTPEELEQLPEMWEFSNPNQRTTFWQQIAPEDLLPYDPRKSKASKIRDPLVRMLHKVFAHTICGRGDSPGNVPTADLLYLYTVVDGTPINIPARMAEFLINSVGKLPGSYICGGEYVTQLAQNMGLLTEAVVAGLTEVTTGSYVDRGTLTRLNLVTRLVHGYHMIGRHGEVWDPLPVVQQQQEQQQKQHEPVAGLLGGPGGFIPPETAHGPQMPSYEDLYQRFGSMEVTMGQIREEQLRQAQVQETMRAENHIAYQWLFNAHISHERYYHDYEPPLPPPPQFPFPCPGAQRPPWRGGDGAGPSGSGGRMDID